MSRRATATSTGRSPRLRRPRPPGGGRAQPAGRLRGRPAVVEATAKRIRSYAGRDAEMRAIVAELDREAREFGAR